MSKIKLCSKDEENLIEELQHLSEVLEEIGVEWGGDWTHSKDYQHFEK